MSTCHVLNISRGSGAITQMSLVLLHTHGVVSSVVALFDCILVFFLCLLIWDIVRDVVVVMNIELNFSRARRMVGMCSTIDHHNPRFSPRSHPPLG